MSPADILAAARANTVGPHLPARKEWLEGWAGPVLGYGWGFGDTRSRKADELLLDVRRPEVRDHLVRRGCPEWARDVPAAVWCWGMGVEVADVTPPWSDAADLAALHAGCILRVEGGWLVPLPGGGVGYFKEPSP